MSIFVYDRTQYQDLFPEILRAKRIPGVVCLGVTENDLRHATRTLLNHDLMVVPSAVQHLTPLVQRIQLIARTVGLQVKPLAAMRTNHHANREAAFQHP